MVDRAVFFEVLAETFYPGRTKAEQAKLLLHEIARWEAGVCEVALVPGETRVKVTPAGESESFEGLYVGRPQEPFTLNVLEANGDVYPWSFECVEAIR